MKKWLAILILIAVGGGGWWYWRQHTAAVAAELKAAEQKPQFADAKKGPFRVVVEATGRVIPEQEIEIKCKASGTIIALPVDVSHPVKKGDLLVQLDPVDEKRSVQQAQVQQAQSQAKLAQTKLNLVIAQQNLATEKIRAEANLNSANSKAADAKAKCERTRQLFEKKMASPEELGTDQLAQAQADADAATAQARIEDLKTLQTQIGLREQDIKIAEQMVQSDSLALEIANQRLTDTTVPSPIDGVVSELDVQV
ncbi:MAG TPA: hypothetical protein VL860_10380, partial [Planctomycetota bacterium]|nr:hypothetical protein [Planctomycetota bacterium]